MHRTAHTYYGKTQNYAITEGLAGGAYGSLQSAGTENPGTSNVGFANPIIMEGRMYYTGPDMPLANGTEQYYMVLCRHRNRQSPMASSTPFCSRRGNTSTTITCGQILDWRITTDALGAPIHMANFKLAYTGCTARLTVNWKPMDNLPAGATVANSTAVPATFGGVNFVPGIATTAVNVLAGTLVLRAA